MRTSNNRRRFGTLLTGVLLVVASVTACNEEILPAGGPGAIALIVNVNAGVATESEQPRSVVTTPETHSEVTPAEREGRRLHQVHARASRDTVLASDAAAAEAQRPPTFSAVRARVRAAGTDRMVELVQSGSFFEATIGDLNPGTYSVTLVGTDAGEVTFYGVNNNVSVVAGDTTEAPISFNAFVATFDPLVTPTHVFTVMPTWSTVPGATSYLLEADTDPAFSNPQQFTSTTNSDILFANDVGTYYLRVRAGNADVDPASAAASNVEMVEIVPGSGAAGSDQASAADLGAGPVAGGLYTNLNILPNEEDWFAVTLRRGQALSVAVLASVLIVPSELDPVVSVLDGVGNLIGANDDVDVNTNRDARLIGMTAPADDIYYIRVQAFDDGAPTVATAEVGHYDLLVMVTVNRLVDGGGHHTCGVGVDRAMYCWGDATYGQLGNGMNTSSSRPVTVSGGIAFVSVAAGADHTCGLDILGKAYCWGNNSLNQLGIGSNANRSAPALVSGTDVFVTLAAGESHTCGITLAGNAKCWGDNSAGEIGNGTTGSAIGVPTAVTGQLKFFAIDAGERITCGITFQYEAFCWGYGDEGNLGDGMSGGLHQQPQPTRVVGGAMYSAIATGFYHTCGITLAGAAQCWGWDGEGRLGNGASTGSAVSTPVAVTGGLVFTSIQAGFGHTCALTTSGTVSCWGVNAGGQGGNGNLASFFTDPVPIVDVGATYTAVATGGVHSCGRETAGSIYCWGENSQGQVGNGATIPNTPQPVTGGAQFGQVSVGYEHSCGVSTGGVALCWGNGNFGQLGNGAFGGTSPSPTAVNTALTFTSIRSGALHTCAIETGTQLASCWGYGLWGQLGNGNTVNQAGPVQAGAIPFSSITTGAYHTCAIAVLDDELHCWGRNFDGQLGDATNVDKSTPTPVASFVGAVSAGGFHTCALDDATQLAFCWGYNGNGQLGTGNQTSSNVPVAVSSGLAFDQITAGDFHTCGRVGGTAYCWGWNGFGQLGDGSFTDASTPVPVSGSLSFLAIEAGARHTCGVTTGGEVYCWGDGDASQTGLGSRLLTTVPTAVSTGGSIIGVSAGEFHACAVTSTGTARCWGNNSRGQLGIGSITSRSMPEVVVGGTVFLDPEADLRTGSVARLDSHNRVVHSKRGR